VAAATFAVWGAPREITPRYLVGPLPEVGKIKLTALSHQNRLHVPEVLETVRNQLVEDQVLRGGDPDLCSEELHTAPARERRLIERCPAKGNVGVATVETGPEPATGKFEVPGKLEDLIQRVQP
jgi:hypothetical protein